jgi:hypothetical protein
MFDFSFVLGFSSCQWVPISFIFLFSFLFFPHFALVYFRANLVILFPYLYVYILWHSIDKLKKGYLGELIDK